MKCKRRIITAFFMITLVISLSNNLHAQVKPYNDECSEAIQIPVAPETSFNEFSLEGAQRSTFAVASTCGNDQHARDVWFAIIMPENGKLQVELSATKECPALSIYSGGCTGLGYLACDASKLSDTERSITLYDASLAGQTLFIRVLQEEETSNDKFEIRALSLPTQSVSVEQLDVKLDGRGVEVAWQTHGETEVHYTYIQHSTDGINFQNLQSIEGRNNNELEHYTFTHDQPQAGANYYRIVMVLESGEAIVFEETEIYVDHYNATVRVFPNPATEGVYIAMPDWVSPGQATLTLTDVSGRIIRQEQIEAEPQSELYFHFANGGLSNGNYLLHLVQKDKLIMNTQLNVKRQ